MGDEVFTRQTLRAFRIGKVFTRRIHIKIGFYKPQIKHIHSYNLKCGRAVALLRRRQSR